MNAIPRLLALALFALAAPLAAQQQPTDAQKAAYTATMQRAQALAQAGDMAGSLRLVGEAAVAVDSGEVAHRLGHYYEGATAVPGYETEALKWFRFAAERKQPDALHHVGLRYFEGSGGLPRDVRKGAEMLDESSQLGYEPAETFMRAWLKEQDAKSRCLLSTLRDDDMQSVVFGSLRFYDFSDTGGDSGGGDTYQVRGGYGEYGTVRGLAELRVDGFSQVTWTDVDGRRFYSDTYVRRPASASARARAAAVRAECGVTEEP